eukprot:1153628-Pelagomonas_calceolata.AAC.1
MKRKGKQTAGLAACMPGKVSVHSCAGLPIAPSWSCTPSASVWLTDDCTLRAHQDLIASQHHTAAWKSTNHADFTDHKHLAR